MAANSISDTTEAAILALVFNATTWANYAINASASPETTINVSLNTSASVADTDTMATNEISYTGYARLAPLRTGAGWTVGGTSPTTVNPASALTFGAMTAGAGGTVTTFTTGKSGGGAAAILWGGSVSPSIVVSNGVTPQLTTATAITLD
jgi:hypothetical protein